MSETRVLLEGHKLLFPIGGRVQSDSIPLSSVEPLASFTRLADASANEIVDFADAWGPLGLCGAHGLPYDHGVRTITIGTADTSEIALPLFCPPRTHEGYIAELLSAWRHLAAAAKALRDTIARLRQHMRPLQADLTNLTATLFGAGGHGKWLHKLAGKEAAFERSRGDAWFLIGERLNEWLGSAPVRFFCEIEERNGRFDVDFTVGPGLGVLPAIAAQLLATLTDPQRGKAIICAGCGLPFIQPREPSRGTRRYCWPCRKAGIAVRDAVRDSRARKRKQSRGQR